MLACSCYFQVFLLLPNIIFSQGESILGNVTYNRTRQNSKEETIFTDVIKNISRVNNVLQELINNYEHIQKMYETKSFEKEYSTDIEMDEVFKEMKSKKKPRAGDISKTKTTKTVFAGTEMFLSDDSKSEIADSGYVNEDDTKRVRDVQHYQAIKKLTNQNTMLNSLNEQFHDNTSTEEDLNKNITLPPQKKDYGPQPNNSIENPRTQDTEESVSLDVDTKSNGKNIKKYVIYTNNKVEIVSTKPIRYTTQKNISRNIKKIIYSETFPRGRIWKEIADKKPIRLSALTTPPKHRIHVESKRLPKTALVILTKNNKEEKVLSNPEPGFSSLSDSEVEDKDIHKQIFKTNILRHAYGEACLKLVVKKCYKACKQTKKVACRQATCKSSLKEKFMENAKTNCIKEFRQVTKSERSDKETVTEDNKDNAIERQFEKKNRATDELDFLDATRQGFPAEVCYPFMKAVSESQVEDITRSNKNQNTTSQKEVKKPNILRDRYEKACRKASSSKCNNACTAAFKETCETYTCSKSLKKAFKKQCKMKCKDAYTFKTSKDKSSGSSSSSSGSGSDSDSDSDDDISF